MDTLAKEKLKMSEVFEEDTLTPFNSGSSVRQSAPRWDGKPINS